MGNVDLLLDACAPLAHTTRKMFGGHGVFAPNGGMFAAVVPGDRIALKLDDEAAAAEFVALGGEPWVYEERMRMSHWFVIPDELYDDGRALAEWTRRAHALAKPPKAKGGGRKAAAKPAAKKPAAKKPAAKKPAAKKPAKKARG